MKRLSFKMLSNNIIEGNVGENTTGYLKYKNKVWEISESDPNHINWTRFGRIKIYWMKKMI